MTVRAVILGLLLGVVIAVFGYFNDWVMKQAFLTTNLTPAVVFGSLLVGLLVVNPLMRLLGPWRLGGGEWAVIVSLMLVACVVPGPGLMWHFSNTILMPHFDYQSSVGWQAQQLMAYVPDVLLVDAYGPANPVVLGFKEGRGRLIPLTAVPWSAWTKTLSFWLPLVGLGFVAAVCLAVVVHRQWSRGEHLRYPIAEVAAEFIRGCDEGPLAAIFRNRRFWVGLAIPMFVLLANGYYTWNPNSVQVPMSLSLRPFAAEWPKLNSLPEAWRLLNPTLFFSAVGFAYFVSSEVSFSLGIANLVFGALFLWLTGLGVDMSSNSMEGGVQPFQMFGSYVGAALFILYCGRHYYRHVLTRALGLGGGEAVEPHVAWACRAAILSAGGMVALLVFVAGLHWLLAVLLVALVGLMFTVLTRINVETGLFMIQPGWYAVAILLAMFGFPAIGPKMFIIMALACLVLTVDPIVSLMPLAANAIRLGEMQRLRPGRLGRWLIVGVLLAMVAGVLGTIWVQYSFGGTEYGWAQTVAKMPFRTLSQNLQGTPRDPAGPQPFRPAEIFADRTFLVSAGVGLALVLAVGALRLRFTWWPIHPVMFLVWSTFPINILGPSFLLGWLIKRLLVGVGGQATYRAYRPFFVGLIAGEFAAGLVWMIVGLVYYANTGTEGPVFRIIPA